MAWRWPVGVGRAGRTQARNLVERFNLQRVYYWLGLASAVGVAGGLGALAFKWLTDEAMGLFWLVKVNLIEKRGRAYVLGPRGSEVAVVELLTLYTADRLVVVGELSSLAMERIRSMASKAFANAFARLAGALAEQTPQRWAQTFLDHLVSGERSVA